MVNDRISLVIGSRGIRYFIALLVLIVAALIVSWSSGRTSIETNMLALLPDTQRSAVVTTAIEQMDSSSARQHIILVGAPSWDKARAAASQMATNLREANVFADVQMQIDMSKQALGAVYAQHQAGFLSDAARKQLLAEGSSAAFVRATEQIYNPALPLDSELLTHDPLLLFYDFVANQSSGRGNLELRDGLLTAHDEKNIYVLLRAQLAGNPFALAEQQRVIPVLDAARANVLQQFPTAQVLDIGAIRYAAAGVESARSEINTIGFASLIGVIVVLVTVFRSPLPMFASLVASAVGYVAALAVCWLWFGSIHLITLVFGSSMLGLSIDHCLHFFADRLAAGKNWDSRTGLHRIFPGITMGLLTTIIGYAALYLTGFPGMQQLAVFSSVGLTGAYLAVIWLYPAWIKRGVPEQHGPWLRYSAQLLNVLRPKGRRWPWLLVIPIAGVLAVGLPQLRSNDDIRALQTPSPLLKKIEHTISTITGVQASLQYFVVVGDTADAVLQEEEQFTALLQVALQRKEISGFDAISNHLPSLKRQTENIELVATALADEKAVREYTDSLGLDAAIFTQYRQAVAAARSNGLELQPWLASAAGEPFRHLWVGRVGQQYGSMIMLHGVNDAAAMRALAAQNSQWHWVDKAGDLSLAFKKYRERGTLLIIFAYAVVALFLLGRYGLRLGSAAMLPTALAAALTLAGLALLGQQINLFHLLALLLVLGIGIDYSLFLIEDDEMSAGTMLAILLSAVTNELSFGLLAVSSTPAVSAFGFTVFFGVAGAALLAPLVVDFKNSRKFNNE